MTDSTQLHPSHTAYDSRADTLLHVRRVVELLNQVITELLNRGVRHDSSKLELPEVVAFDEHTPRLKLLEYGTDEYRAELDAMRPALEHHYAVNRHHPEHFSRGIGGMTLVDLIEMLADWKAASERGAHGDLRTSLRFNRRRFTIDNQLYAVLLNTAMALEWMPVFESSDDEP